MRIVPIKRAVVQGTREALLVPHQLNRETFRLQEELCLGGDRVRWFRLRAEIHWGQWKLCFTWGKGGGPYLPSLAIFSERESPLVKEGVRNKRPPGAFANSMSFPTKILARPALNAHTPSPVRLYTKMLLAAVSSRPRHSGAESGKPQVGTSVCPSGTGGADAYLVIL